MPGGYLHGWDPVGEGWVRVECNADGKLLVDPTLILEDSPTDGELAKAPTSNWAFDHDADVDAHHVKYTDVNARASISDILDLYGRLTGEMDAQYNSFNRVVYWRCRQSEGDNRVLTLIKTANQSNLYLYVEKVTGGYDNASIRLLKTDHDVWVIDQDNFQTELALYLEEAPTNGVVNKAPTSNWAFDHDADVSAHHVKYTDLEAQTACNLNGDLYLTVPGIDFRPGNPHSDSHSCLANGTLQINVDNRAVRCPLMLPDGATVTSCIVDGNAGASSQYWELNRITLSDLTVTQMGTNTVQTADTSIANALVDNSLYMYVITISGLNTNDLIYYSQIKYTL